MPTDNSPRPSAILVGFAILVIGSCVFPIGEGMKMLLIPDPLAFFLGLTLIFSFGTIAFAQYISVFRRSRFFSSVSIATLSIINVVNLFILWTQQYLQPKNPVERGWIVGIAFMTLLYACSVVLTYRWETKIINARLSERPTEPAKNLKLIDLFAITTFAAGVMGSLVAF